MGQLMRKGDSITTKILTINWVSPRPSLAGGVKSNRLIAEAMVRRGHHVNILYVDAWRQYRKSGGLELSAGIG